jgi:hypothetical protein
VIDTETLAFKRMWGAYGNKPDDENLGPYNPEAPLAQQFRLPHNVALSKDGLVYVADRPNDRIQVFKKDGTFVRSVTACSSLWQFEGTAAGTIVFAREAMTIFVQKRKALLCFVPG